MNDMPSAIDPSAIDDEEVRNAADEARLCAWCGDDLVVGRPFCPSCGRPVTTSPSRAWARRAKDADRDVIYSIFAGVMGAIAILWIISFKVDVDWVKDNFLSDEKLLAAECDGVIEWNNASKQRAIEAEKRFADYREMVDDSLPSEKEIREVIADLRAMADAQRNSNPPAIAARLNTLLTDGLEQTAQAYEAYFFRGQASGDALATRAALSFDLVKVEDMKLRERCNITI